MILQRFDIPDNECSYKQLFYRSILQMKIVDKRLYLPAGLRCSSDTYINTFDCGFWKKYTDISNIYLKIKLGGNGYLVLKTEQQNGYVRELYRERYGLQSGKVGSKEELKIKIPFVQEEEILYFEILPEEDTILYDAFFETSDTPKRNIMIAAVICTYKRQNQLKRLLNELHKGTVTESGESGDDWLQVIVIDNASEMKGNYGKNIKFYHNPNTGGSGGFARGMLEVVADLKQFSATHVLLMDDDVTLRIESIYRLRALLSYMKGNYENEIIAGRMFRQDMPNVQYTAAEIWNGGNLKHIGWNRDMTKRDALWDMNDNTGAEFSGWWFACFPIGFIKNNRPLPFFLHCDDVEYGLRHGGTPVILNGIQVWHETYEYRQSTLIEYYDMRNMAFVNKIIEFPNWHQHIWTIWKAKVEMCRKEKDLHKEYMINCGMFDFLKGLDWLKHVEPEKKNRSLLNSLNSNVFIRNYIMVYILKFIHRRMNNGQ